MSQRMFQQIWDFHGWARANDFPIQATNLPQQWVKWTWFEKHWLIGLSGCVTFVLLIVLVSISFWLANVERGNRETLEINVIVLKSPFLSKVGFPSQSSESESLSPTLSGRTSSELQEGNIRLGLDTRKGVLWKSYAVRDGLEGEAAPKCEEDPEYWEAFYEQRDL